MTPRDCPGCKGSGWKSEQHGGATIKYACGWCDGTGDREAARLRRAYRLGLQDGIEALRNAMPVYPAMAQEDIVRKVNQEAYEQESDGGAREPDDRQRSEEGAEPAPQASEGWRAGLG